MSQVEYDVGEYILNNPECFTKLIPEVVKERMINSKEREIFREEFNNQQEQCMLSLIKDYIGDVFNLNSEELNVMITKSYMESLLGNDYFRRIYDNKS